MTTDEAALCCFLSMFILLMVRLTKADVRSVICGGFDASSEESSSSSSFASSGDADGAVILAWGGGHTGSLLLANSPGSIFTRSDGPWNEDTSDSTRTHNVLIRCSEKDACDEMSWNEIDSYPYCPPSET